MDTEKERTKEIYRKFQNEKDEEKRGVLRIMSVAIMNILFMITFIVFAAFLITYFQNLTSIVVYLVEISIMLSSFIAGLMGKNFKEMMISTLVFAAAFFFIIWRIAKTIPFTLSMLYLLGIIVLSSTLGYLLREYVRMLKNNC